MWTWHFVLLSAILSLDLGGTTQVELDGPQLSWIPASLTHFSNSVGLTLSCRAKGPPPLIISWLGGEDMEELPHIPGVREQLQNGSLHFSPFSPEQFIPSVHDGPYRCSVRNPVGTFLSPVFSVRAILDHPFEVTIKTTGEWMEGSPALLTCEVSPGFYGRFVKAVGWKEIDQFGHEREIKMDGDKYLMSCDGSLLILSAKVQQLFVCNAQNRLNKRMVASPPFLLKSQRIPPQPPPGIISGGGGGSGGIRAAPRSILSKNVICGGGGRENEVGSGEEDDSFSSSSTSSTSPSISSPVNKKIRRIDLLCLGVGNPIPAFRWEKYVPGVGGDDEGGKLVRLGATGPLLQLPYYPTNETYRCEAHNAFGNYSNTYSVSQVEEEDQDHIAPVHINVTVEPRRILVNSVQNVEFTCRIEKATPTATNGMAYSTSSSTADIKWFKDGKPLPEPGSGGGGGSRVRATSTKLFIFNAHLGDQGVYQCFSQDGTATGGGTLLFPSSAPELVHTFISQSLQPGPDLTLKCTAVGNPAPIIWWEVDGENVSTSMDGSGGGGGTLQSATATTSTSTSTLHGFWSQSQSQSQHSSRYSVGGDRGSRRQRELFLSYFNISGVRVEDSGAYKCTAANLVGSISHIARINVFGPIFVKEMGPLTLVHGKTVQIPCHYGGFPVDKVVWEKDSQSITEMERMRGAKGASASPRFLVFPNGTLQIGRISTEQDKGAYTCRVTNRKGEVATGTVHVNVMRPPVISPFKFEPDLNEGQRASISCNVLSGDLPMSIKWWKDGQPFPPHLNISENRVKFISFIIIEELREEHTGQYTCSASNAAAVVKLSTKLEVRVPPKWIKVPQDTKAILKSEQSFSCIAKGVPPPSISWFRETNGIKSELLPNKKYSLVDSGGTLTIHGVEETDSSAYTCEAANGVGNGISRSIRLDVIIPAKISATIPSLIVAEGGRATMQCLIRGDRPVEVIWKRNSSVILIQNQNQQPPHPQIVHRPGTSSLVQKVVELNESLLSATLEIGGSEMNDSGVYFCLASNLYGRDEDRITLQVKARPNPPENFVVEEIGSRLIRLRWSKPASHSRVPITQFILEWRKSSSAASALSSSSLASWDGTSPAGGATQVFNMSVQFPQSYAVIEGLSPVSNYQVRLFAWNDIGGSLPTEPLTVLTLPEAPSGPPRNVSAVQISPKSLLVKWEPLEGDKQHGTILGYQVIAQLQTSGLGPTSSISNGTVVLVDQKWEQQSEVKGLHPNSPYRISVRGYNSAGMGPESGPFFIQTQEGAPDSPPLNLQCEALSPKSLQVAWEPPPAHLSNGQILGYKVIYIPVQTGMGVGGRMGEKPEVKKTGNRETTLHGLRSYTSYAVRILAYTAGGESETSKPVNCTTEEDVPDEPADIKVLMTGSTSVLVSWLPPHSPNGLITKYTVFWKSDEIGVTREKQYVPISMTSSTLDHQPSFELRRLKEGQRYSFWVSASSNAGLGRPSKTEVVQLMSTPSSSSSAPKIDAKIASFPVSKNVMKGHPIRLPCKAVGIPPPKLSWFKDGTPIPSNGLLRNGSLLISRVQDDDEGEYICRAENELGSDELHHGIIISRPPSSIQIFIGYVTDTSIQIHWEPPEKADPPLTGYLLEYRHEDSSNTNWNSLGVDSLLTSYSLENLLCGTQYELRLSAQNPVGLGEPSEVTPARTNGHPPESSPRLTEILSGNQTMIRIDLNRWPDGGCPLTTFQIDYKKEEAGTILPSEWMKIYRKDNATKVFIIPTQPEGKYLIKIRMGNDAGFVSKTFLVEAHPDFFLNYAKVLERVEVEERLNGGSGLIPFYTDPHVLVPIVSAVICTAALTVCVFMLIKRKKQSKSGWQFNASTSQQSWLSSSDQHAKCGGGGGGEDDSSKCGTEECMSIYATLNSTKPIPMTIRDSTVRLQSFGQHDNYDAPHPQHSHQSLISRRGSGGGGDPSIREQHNRKSRRKSKSSSSPLEDLSIEQISCQMDSFPSKIEPPREFRSSSSMIPVSAQQLHQFHQGQSPHHNHNHNHNHYLRLQMAPNPYQNNSSGDEDGEAEVGNNLDRANEIGRRLEKSFTADEMLYHDYSCPYQFTGKQAETDASGKASRPGTLKKSKHGTKVRNKSREYFD